MSVLKTLRERVAPELNHLYTVPPSEIVGGGLDYGWRPREHAWHAFFVARMFGADANLCTGDFAVLSRFAPPLTSMGSELGHAWCAVNGVAPIDLSLTFRNFGQMPQLRNAILGEGRNGDWEIEYSEDESPLDESVQQGRNEILFIEKETRTDTAAALLENPYLFLRPPDPADTQSWPAVHGADIHAKIALHCFRCATGRAKSVRPRLNREQAIAWIAQNYHDAASEIATTLAR